MVDSLCAAPECRGSIEVAAARVELQKRDTLGSLHPAFFQTLVPSLLFPVLSGTGA